MSDVFFPGFMLCCTRTRQVVPLVSDEMICEAGVPLCDASTHAVVGWLPEAVAGLPTVPTAAEA